MAVEKNKMDALMEEYGGSDKIDKRGEFKDFEEVLNDPDGKDKFIQVIGENENDILNLFDVTALRKKINDADNMGNSDVRGAYIALGAYLDGKKGSYSNVLEQAETERALAAAKQALIDKINSNPDRDNLLKKSAIDTVNDLFEECDSVEEFERRAGTRIDTLEGMDNVGDFFKGIPSLISKSVQTLDVQRIRFFEAVGVTKENIVSARNKGIELGVLKRNDFIDWCKEKGMSISETAKMVCEWGKDQFVGFINVLKNTGENVSDALKAAWEWTGKKWDAFADFCGQSWDAIKDFGISLLEKGEIAWHDLVDRLGNKWDQVGDLCKDLIEKGLLKVSELAERCKGVGEKGKEIMLSVIERNVNLWKDFADFCKDNWEGMKEMFSSIITNLIEKGKVTINACLEWCKGAWETVKDTVCNVLVSLVKAGKIALEFVVDSLMAVVGLTVYAVSELLISAGKLIYKGAVLVGNFVKGLSITLWEKAKEAGIAMTDFVKNFISKCKEFALMTGEYIEGIVKGLWESMKDFGMKASEFMKATYDVIKSRLRNSWNKTADFFKNIGLKVADIAATMWEVSKHAWEGCVSFVTKYYKNFTDAMNVLKNKCKMALDKIGEYIVATGEKIADFILYVKELGEVTFENIKKWCKNSWETITNFLDVAINKVKISREKLKSRCGGQIDKIATCLRSIFGKTKEGIKNFIRFVGEGVQKAGEYLLKLGIGTVKNVISALKDFGCKLENVAEMVVKFTKENVKSICNRLSEAYGNTKEMVINIGKSVAKAINNSAKAVRDRIYEKTNDAKRAFEAMNNYIKEEVSNVAEWLYRRGVTLKDVCSTVYHAFGNSLEAAWEGLKTFANNCGIGIRDLLYACGDWVNSLLV